MALILWHTDRLEPTLQRHYLSWIQNLERKHLKAVTKSGTGTWDGDVGLGTRGLGDTGTWDAGTRGLGTRGRGDVGLGDAGTWGRGDVRTWDSGTRGRGTRGRGDVGLGDAGTWDSGTRGRGDVRLGDAGTWGRGDVINKKHPNDPLYLQFTVFVIWWSVCQQISSLWFLASLIAQICCLLAYFIVRALGTETEQSFNAGGLNLMGSHGWLGK